MKRVSHLPLAVAGASWSDLDPLEFARFRRMVEENRGDTVLLELSDDELARALGLIREENGLLRPTLAGLLLMGKETALSKHAPTHEIAFQVLRGTDVKVNEFHRWPLLRVHEWITQAIDVRNEELELMVGSIRVGIPRYDRQGLREAINNALIHRDYSQLGAIHVQLYQAHVQVSSPGGFVIGVNVNNLLTVAPRPRNPLLADIFKRVGLVERTGRGINIIFNGQLRNGRRPPNYHHSTETSVQVLLDSGPTDLDFVRFTILAKRRMGDALRVEELLAMWCVWQEKTVAHSSLTPIQRNVYETTALLDSLVQHGILQVSEGEYTLSDETAHIKEGEPFLASPETTILDFVIKHGRITRREAAALTGLTDEQTRYQLRKLTSRGELELIGSGRGALYRIPGMGQNGE